jgi:hypothetical protein
MKTVIDLDSDLTEAAAKVVGTTTKKETSTLPWPRPSPGAGRKARRREHWKREKALDGSFDAVIGNGNGDPTAHTKGEGPGQRQGLHVLRRGTWTKQ